MARAIGPGEAAKRLGVSTRTVQRWLREGKLPAVRVGSRLKVDASAFEKPAAAFVDPFAPTGARPIRRLLVANRGELVVRIAATCRRLRVACLALVAEDQARAWWASAADELVPLRGTYLDQEAVVDAALRASADAIHPGYGFLAENADFAERVTDAGLAWIGPPAAAMRALGDKAAARRLAAGVGVPVLAGYDEPDQTPAALRRAARHIGYPILVKPSGGGGGKGMHVVRSEGDLDETLARARREAKTAFGDERLILERHLERPRHIEVQLLADEHGNVIHLGERECSLQRRHQKVVEEAPSPAVDKGLRERLGEAALRLAMAGGYVGAGTAEFLIDGSGAFYFLELNARLQVEHPVTEVVTGRDLVADQLQIAAGEPLDIEQSEVRITGHAIEARLYAEDPWNSFLPATGELHDVAWPEGGGVRVDAGVGRGDVVGARYDPLLAKVIAGGPDRATALERLDNALGSTVTLGVTTNRGFLRWLLALPDVRGGQMDTELIDRLWQPDSTNIPEEAWQAAARRLATRSRVGFRLNESPRLAIEIDGDLRLVEIASLSGEELRNAMLDEETLLLDAQGRAVTARLARPPTIEGAIRHAAHGGAGHHSVTAPMPGQVLDVRVSEGDEVEAGQVLLVLEAMKMENAVVSPAPARVASVLVEPGRQVQRGEALFELT